MLDPQVLLADVEAAIQARLQSGAYDEYSEGDQRFKGMSLADLREFRTELQQEIAVNGGSAGFERIVPLDEGGGCG